jgi:transcriptional regulator with XRE-family HTH domain
MPKGADKLAVVVGRNMLRRRKALGYTQEQLAEAVGIEQQSLSRMENGHLAPRFGRLSDIASTLGCSVADLFQPPDSPKSDMADAVAILIENLSEASQQALLKVVAELSMLLAKMEKAGKPTTAPESCGQPMN